MSTCCQTGGSCLCGSLPVYKSSDVKEPVRFGGTKLSRSAAAALDDIGIDYTWVDGEMTEEDAMIILASHKFLNSGDWGDTADGERIFITDQKSFDYAMGKIAAEDYLRS